MLAALLDVRVRAPAMYGQPRRTGYSHVDSFCIFDNIGLFVYANVFVWLDGCWWRSCQCYSERLLVVMLPRVLILYLHLTAGE